MSLQPRARDAQDRLADFQVAAEHGVHAFAPKCFGEFAISPHVALHQTAKAFCLCHLSFPFQQ
jgi:hypothetical protein